MILEIIKTNFQYTKPLIPLDRINVTTIIIHHAEAFVAEPEDIHKWHIQKGYNGAGYNFYVRKDGTVYEMRGFNIGAQCEGMNSKSVGICCEGNWEIDSELPEKMMISLVDCINYVRKSIPNTLTIEPHMKFYPTACPGRFLYHALVDVRECVEAFGGLEKLTVAGMFGTIEYWKRITWLKINPNAEYFRAALVNANRRM